jgi:hypothetical protein
MTSPSDDPFEALGVTPELTEAAKALSDLNVLRTLLTKLNERVPVPDHDALIAKLDLIIAWQVEGVNDLLRREEILKRGL